MSSSSATLQLRLTATLDVHTLEDNLHVYRLRMDTGLGPMGGDFAFPVHLLPQSVEDQGLVDDEGLKVLHRLGPGQKPARLPLSFMTVEDQEALRSKGYMGVMEKHEKEKTYHGTPLTSVYDLFVNHPGISAEDLVRVDYGNHAVFTRQGLRLPQQVRFDYITSSLSESTHDLEALAAHLLTRPDVHVIDPHNYASRKDWGDPPKSARAAVMTIPHYNSEEGRTQSVEFVWVPEDADYARWVDTLEQQKVAALDRFRVFFELDILNVDQFRVTPGKSPRHRM
jgi:hypothetical protein